MQKSISHSFKLITFLLLVLGVSSCSKKIDFSNLEDSFMVRHKNADMPAYVYGNGSEKIFLITLHGGPGGLGKSFRTSAFKDDLEKTCAVVYFDQRGSGMSQGNYSESELTVDLMAEDILALVKVIKHKYGNDSRFFLLGHSWGGTLGISVLLKEQSAFLGWIQLDGTGNPKGMYTEYITNFERVASEQMVLGNSVDFWQGTLDLVRNVSPDFNQADFSEMNKKAFEAEQQLSNDGFINTGGNNSDLFFNYNLVSSIWNTRNTQSIIDPEIRNLSYTSKMPDITLPMLILWGKHDMVVPPAFANEVFDNIGSNSKDLVFFENSGHSPNQSEPELFATEVIQFMDQHK